MNIGATTRARAPSRTRGSQTRRRNYWNRSSATLLSMKRSYIQSCDFSQLISVFFVESVSLNCSHHSVLACTGVARQGQDWCDQAVDHWSGHQAPRHWGWRADLIHLQHSRWHYTGVFMRFIAQQHVKQSRVHIGLLITDICLNVHVFLPVLFVCLYLTSCYSGTARSQDSVELDAVPWRQKRARIHERDVDDACQCTADTTRHPSFHLPGKGQPARTRKGAMWLHWPWYWVDSSIFVWVWFCTVN